MIIDLVGMRQHFYQYGWERREISELQEFLAPLIQLNILRNATRDETISILPDQEILHFSGHGHICLFDPSQSSLLLEDWKLSPLTVSDLVSLKLQSLDSHLCPCVILQLSTTFGTLYQSINLSPAVLLAGVPSVVGTL
jgi:CHAT domain-containing protein